MSRRAALALGVALWVAGPPAWAQGGKVVWKKTTVDERDGVWRINVEIHLDRAPDVAHLPVRFSFKEITHFERALVDGKDQPVTRKVPLEHQTPSVESVDVGFLDPGTGKIERRTRFSFEVTRERGFEAGQYEVEISDGRSNSRIGEVITATLDGENPVVDRRAMVFSDKKKETGGTAAASPKAAEKRQLSENDPEFWAGGPKAPEPEDKPLPPPASMQEKPGACGCRVGGTTPGSGAGGVALVALVFGFLARRKDC